MDKKRTGAKEKGAKGMAFERYIRCGQKQLRCGYTTGTCAALAAGGAVQLLLGGQAPATLSLSTPGGWQVQVQPTAVRVGPGWAECAVQKDAGDDPDITNGLLIYARAQKTAAGFAVCGGEGIGRVTKPGLDQPVGEWAINSTPRRMIRESARKISAAFGYSGGLQITISAPGGEALAKKTFNPQLGIVGGLSILGTSGIVEPMSEAALIESMELELRQARAQSPRLILTPGNYGTDFLAQQGWNALGVPVVKCSNYVGEALDQAAVLDFAEILLVGHMGKLCKLSAGIMNTHSRMADGRAEIFTAQAALAGADAPLCRRLMQAATSDACIEFLQQAGLSAPVLQAITQRAGAHAARRAGEERKTGLVVFSRVYGLLGETETAKELLNQWKTT